MGVSGSGKSTVAKLLAQHLDYFFIDADDYHSEAARHWMNSGKALSDEMREPWIQRLCSALENEKRRHNNCVLAYSGLKRRHRQRFRQLGFDTLFVYLRADQSIIAARIEGRREHFMSPALLVSQFESMEEPVAEIDVVPVDVSAPLTEILKQVIAVVQEFFSIT